MLRSGVWLVAGDAAARAAGMLKVAILGRLLSPSDFRLMGVAVVLLGWLDYFTQPEITAALIRTARTESGLTQVQLAARIGISQAALAKLERPGSNPTVRTLERVLRAAGRRLQMEAPRDAPAVPMRYRV